MELVSQIVLDVYQSAKEKIDKQPCCQIIFFAFAVYRLSVGHLSVLSC